MNILFLKSGANDKNIVVIFLIDCKFVNILFLKLGASDKNIVVIFCS